MGSLASQVVGTRDSSTLVEILVVAPDNRDALAACAVVAAPEQMSVSVWAKDQSKSALRDEEHRAVRDATLFSRRAE